ncbi:DNA-binding protein [Rodentibacter caecimuris]|uniref:DNA-binding protein n=1 Tax=Rodentibacter caecimuris TaxID=1796644 RepID=A0A1V3KMM1_9PAST|nr:DNA-binding protein [Rodentibacter heylii]OOF78901.1 DNA-binding protein [Rodentibacter heylii]
MNNDLTTSLIARDNVLNNKYALAELENNLQLGGLRWENETIFTKQQVAQILDIDIRTIERYIADYADELSKNGYRLLKGKSLKDMKLAYVSDIDVGDISPKAPSLGIFTFRAVLNLAMLVTESERAKFIRSRMLDIVIDVIAQKTGGKTKFINQRDTDYLPAAYMEESYRKQFTNALRDYLEMGDIKYGLYTDKIYKVIFCENTKEYRKILKLAAKDKTRDTMYAEVLKAIGSFENGLAKGIRRKSEALGRKLQPVELDQLIQEAAESPFLEPFILDARTKMSSWDLGFREVLHEKLSQYIQAVPENDFERFLGERSRSLQEQLEDNNETLAVLQRLKDR